MNKIIPLLLIFGILLIAGCAQLNQQSSSQDSASLSDSDQVLDSVESTLLDESNDIELGSLI